MRVLNLNIWNQNYYWEKRLPLIIDLLTKTGFNGKGEDVLVFHEMTSTPDHNQLAELNKSFGYQTIEYFEVKNEVNRSSGIGVLTNFPIIRRERFFLTVDVNDPDDSFPRIVGAVELERSNHNLILVVTHFSVSGKAQIRNATESLGFILGFNKELLPIVMCCDFNCAPNEAPAILYKQNQFEDVWAALGNQEFASWPVDTELVVENHLLKHGEKPPWEIIPRRIDYIWQKGIKAKSVEKIGSKVNGLWHSDHWGILAVYE
jgi:endonuclease/exonuclease/phosphatase family metal-dependent hydrolase